MRMLVNLLCDDIDAQMAFYQRLFGFVEFVAHRSPIYRGLDTGAGELGFNAPAARELLALAPLQVGATSGPRLFATFQLAEPSAVDAAASLALELGGQVVKAPFQTYYGQWQAVLADPEGQVFRVACLKLPESV